MGPNNASDLIMLLGIGAVNADDQIVEARLFELDRLFRGKLQARGEEICHRFLRINMLDQIEYILSKERISLGKGNDAASQVQRLVYDPSHLLIAQLALTLPHQAVLTSGPAASRDLHGECGGNRTAYRRPGLIDKQPPEGAAGYGRKPGADNHIVGPDQGRLLLRQPLVHDI